MYEISKTTRSHIEKAIADVESKSSCELVAVLSKRSENYIYLSILLSSVISLLIPFFLLTWLPFADSVFIYKIQIIVFVILFLLFRVEKVLFWLLPKRILQAKARLKAYETFNMLGLQKTSNHQAVMIFVSIYERYVQIIADSGISNKIDDRIWQETVDQFTKRVKNRQFETGYLEAIESIGEILIKEFPVQENDENELSNHLVEI